jgi:predicted site-specific integrase-resolvase
MSRRLNTAELAEHFGVKQDTVRGWVAAGRIPALLACDRGKLMFDLNAVEAALRRWHEGKAEAAAGAAS